MSQECQEPRVGPRPLNDPGNECRSIGTFSSTEGAFNSDASPQCVLVHRTNRITTGQLHPEKSPDKASTTRQRPRKTRAQIDAKAHVHPTIGQPVPRTTDQAEAQGEEYGSHPPAISKTGSNEPIRHQQRQVPETAKRSQTVSRIPTRQPTQIGCEATGGVNATYREVKNNRWAPIVDTQCEKAAGNCNACLKRKHSRHGQQSQP